MCYESCQNVIDKCEGVVTADQLPNCTALSATSQPIYPKKKTEMVVNGEVVVVQCFHSENDTQAPVSCYFRGKLTFLTGFSFRVCLSND